MVVSEKAKLSPFFIINRLDWNGDVVSHWLFSRPFS
jgi:hypothetical protein